jgi:uncharacterized membrane protein
VTILAAHQHSTLGAILALVFLLAVTIGPAVPAIAWRIRAERQSNG